MTHTVKYFIKLVLCVNFIGLPVVASEIGIDGSFASSPIVEAWGIGSHAQIISERGYGIDLGARYFSDLSYSTESYGTLNQESFIQYEIAALKQWGDKGIRFQALAGGLISGNDVSTTGGSVINQFGLGYRADLGISVPIFTHFRAFAELGYQGWSESEMPSNMRWRYGLRFNFGGSEIPKLEEVEQQEAQAVADKEAQELINPSVSIDSRVPEYVPSSLSESLPPIIAYAELCKCFPAGPYTLQLGEFKNMEQAVRGLEYRGLRQFFNSRAYQKNPLPVFLPEVDDYGAVAVFIGEIADLTELRYWRHELRKNGLSARFHKVVGTDGNRVDNPTMVVDPAFLEPDVTYTALEIARMNSLPGQVINVPESSIASEAQNQSDGTSVGSSEVGDSSQTTEVDVTAMNQAPMMPVDSEMDIDEANHVVDEKTMVEGYVQVGPLPMSSLLTLIDTPDFKRVLGQDKNINLPAYMTMDWDETRQEAWLYFTGFETTQALDTWLTGFTAQGYAAESTNDVNYLLGDIYHFTLGAKISSHSVEIDRSESSIQILERLRSPEVLWFEAYQRINQRPVSLSLNWSQTDERYRIIVANIETEAEQTVIWTNLSAVGLMPSLAEE